MTKNFCAETFKKFSQNNAKNDFKKDLPPCRFVRVNFILLTSDHADFVV